MTSSSLRGETTTSACRPASAADMMGLNQLKSVLFTRKAVASRECGMASMSRRNDSISAFTLHCALVPAAQREVGDERQQNEDQDSRAGDHEKRREHARNLELVAGFEDTVGEARLDAAGAGDELGDHGADQGKAA